MLPIPELDDERFRQIAEQARSMIPRLCPGWTDHNDHDPGITFLELFAFLKESQQYHLDQIGPRNRQKFLKLLGGVRQERSPARTCAAVWARTDGGAGLLPRGTRLLAGDIPFETECAADLSGGRLTDGFVWDGERRWGFQARSGGKLRLELLGREAAPGSACYFRFDRPWSGALPLRLYFWVSQEWPVARNPADGAFRPLAELRWEVLDRTGWRALTVEEDQTKGLLFTGAVVLTGGGPCPWADAPEEARSFLERPGAWLRVLVERGVYDVPPVVTGVSDAMVPVCQRETDALCKRLTLRGGRAEDDSLLAAAGEYAVYRPGQGGTWQRCEGVVRTARPGGGGIFTVPGAGEEEVLLLLWRPGFARGLGVGDGFPGQSYALPGKGQLAEDLQLLIAEPDQPGVWSLWERVEDFDASGPEDRHYLLDEAEGTVSFGDCVCGMAPEGEILLAGHAVTLGPGGNVKAGQVAALDGALSGVDVRAVAVTNPDDASGGRDRESIEDCQLRCRRQMRRSDRAVTYADYERLVRAAPGLMISNCKAVPVQRLPRPDGSLEENCVTVVVEPYSLRRERTLSPAYTDNILRYLEDRRMLGTKVKLLPPAYVNITVYAEILSQPHYVDARERIQAAVADFFQKGWEFGAPVRYSVLYGIIDTLDCVQGVEALTIDAQGKGISRGINGDVLLPYNALAVLKSASYQVRPGE